eukprot:m.213250 g.213250  ORF g.213250 m.213250 type:complete len:72 (-) comp18602_c0_seq5:1103-1318(-)
MSSAQSAATGAAALEAPLKQSASPPEGLKPCCACPETRKPRDQCIVENGEEACQDLIEAHKECMRNLGFKV